ncbi:MAG: hypothetical protein Q7V15_03510 [Phenylobacterium sp.]|uniref:hypothetical protein n=1 Tax=Phenylobacterium sp. TaxID=1871053 RepID=UPI00272112BB|nr:hypothetical protein [Phenylobacterium sp.]MDO8900401.1 hypothetical protein [Phenylobacterium sp.]
MSAVADARAAQVAVFRDYFGLQLAFAETLAARSGLPLSEAVRGFTNLHRRLSLGEVSEAPPGAEWRRYAEGLDRAPDAPSRLDWTMEVMAAAPDEPPQPNKVRFGCFSYDPPDAGVVRIHFNNHDSRDGAGPLARSKVGARRSELARMFAHLRRTAPEAETVAGASWLYHVEAYRRLFPPAYTASATLAGKVGLTGVSSWGQFLTHQGAVKGDLSQTFLEGLGGLDPDAPWLAFPLRPLRVSAPIACFEDHFGLG